MRRFALALLLVLCVVAPAFAQQPMKVTLQSAAAANQNGVSQTVVGFTTVTMEYTLASAFDGTINPETSTDTTTFTAVVCRKQDTGVIATTFTAVGKYICPIQGADRFRARISGWTTGNATVVAEFTGPGVDSGVVATLTAPAAGSLQDVNVKQINGITTTMGNGVSGTGVQRVTVASDSTGQTALAAGTATIGALTANQSVNVAQINGITPLMGSGTMGTGSHRVTIASDNDALTVKQATATNLNAAVVGTGTAGTPAGNILTVQGVASMTKFLVTPDSVALPANQSVNVAQINGVAPSMGVGATGTGVQRTVAATNDPCQSSGIAKSSVVLNVTTSAQIIAASGSTTIYVCGYNATVGGTIPTYQFQYGTGSVCATGITNLSGTYAPTVGSFNSYLSLS